MPGVIGVSTISGSTGGTTGGTISSTVGGTTSGVALGVSVGGSTLGLVGIGAQMAELIPYTRDGVPSLRLVCKGGPMMVAGGDPLLGKPVTLTIDCGTGNGPVLRFSGDFTDVEQDYVEQIGWTRTYTALGLRNRMDWVAFTNNDDNTDTAAFNLDPSDPLYSAALAGRSVGQILQQCLDYPDNNTNLTALGIGNYITNGFGASATCTLSGSGVGSSISITSPGVGYATAPNVFFEGGGGYGATGTAAVSGGSVTGITLGSSGAGYSSPPTVVLSGLPAVTLNDLAGLTTIYPNPVYVQGEKLGGAIDSSLRQLAPNYAFHVDPHGYMRFLDMRSLGQPLFLFTNGGGSGAQATCTVVGGVIQNSVVVTSGGTGYSSSTPPTVLIVDSTGTGATATCSVSGGVVVSVTVTAGGTGYSSPKRLVMGYDLVDVAGVKIQTSARDNFSRVEVRGASRTEAVYLETAAPPGSTVTGATNGLAELFAHDGLTNSQAKAHWKLSDFNEPSQDPGQASITITINSTTHVVNGFTNLNGGYGYTSTPVVHLSGGGGTGASMTASISGGSVVSLITSAAGSGYTSAPTAIIDAASGGNSDVGLCTIPSSTQVTITSSDAHKVWAADYWDQSASGRHGQIVLCDPITAGVNAHTRANIISHPALTAGGTCTLTIDQTLPLSSYTSYVIVGLVGGASNVWRKYQVTDPATALALQTVASIPVPWLSADGSVGSLTSTPVCSVLYSSSGQPPYQEAPIDITIDPVAGTITTIRPVVQVFGSTTANQIGGSSTTGIPASVRAMLLVAKGLLEAFYPPNNSIGGAVYAGSAYSVLGLEKTLIVTAPGWKYVGNQANMEAYASDLFDSCSQLREDWNVPYLGIFEPALAFGVCLNLAGNGYITGKESSAMPILECSLTWNLSNNGAKYSTNMHCSNRRAPHQAALFQRPTPIPWHIGVEGTFSSDPTLNTGTYNTAGSGIDFGSIDTGLEEG